MSDRNALIELAAQRLDDAGVLDEEGNVIDPADDREPAAMIIRAVSGQRSQFMTQT